MADAELVTYAQCLGAPAWGKNAWNVEEGALGCAPRPGLTLVIVLQPAQPNLD